MNIELTESLVSPLLPSAKLPLMLVIPGDLAKLAGDQENRTLRPGQLSSLYQMPLYYCRFVVKTALEST